MLFLRFFVITAFLFFISCENAQAQTPIYKKTTNPPLELQFPVSCSVGDNCWIVNYPDNDLDALWKDYKGGFFTYNDCKGMDVAAKTVLDLKNGVSVLAAQDGVVKYVRNNIEDNFSEKDSEAVPFCGNSVVLEHNNGWKTVYCHLKKGSIKLKRGDFAHSGSKIGEMGLSGSTTFPHLYFLVFHDNNYFDPFSGLKLSAEGKKKKYKPLWNSSTLNHLKYKKVLLTNIGTSIEPPHIDNIKDGKYENLEILNNVPSIFLWAYGFHFKKGDFLKFSLKNSNQEKILDKVVNIKQDLEENSFYTEKINEDETWKPGNYEGKIEFLRPESGISKEYVFNFEVKEPPKPVDEEALRQEKLKKTRMQRRKRTSILKKLYEKDKLPEHLQEREYLFKNFEQEE